MHTVNYTTIACKYHCGTFNTNQVLLRVFPGNLCSNGDVRLVGGLVDIEGTVEFCVNGSWNSLCQKSWGYQEAFVVCRQLGLPATGKK